MLSVATTPEEVQAGILALDSALAGLSSLPAREAADLIQALPRARSWVAVQVNGEWKVGFSKFVGHVQPNGAPLTPALYARQRRNISGTDSERAIKRLAGTAYRVGAGGKGTRNQHHPAVDTVLSTCRRIGKQPNTLAEVYVLQGQDLPESEREKVAMILASIQAAKLSNQAVRNLLERIEEL